MKDDKHNNFLKGKEKIKSLANLTALSENAGKIINWIKTKKKKSELAVLLLSILMFLTMCKNADKDITQEKEDTSPANPPIKIENIEASKTITPTKKQIKKISELIEAEEKNLDTVYTLPSNSSSQREEWAKKFLARNPIGVNAYIRFKETFYSKVNKDSLGSYIWQYGLRYITVAPFENVHVIMAMDPLLVGEEAFEQQLLYLNTLDSKASVFMFYNYLVHETIDQILKYLNDAKVSSITDREMFSYILKYYQHPTDAKAAVELMYSTGNQDYVTRAAKAHYYCDAKGGGSIKGRLWEYLIAIKKIKPSDFLKHDFDYFAKGVDAFVNKEKQKDSKADFNSLFVQKDKNSFTTNMDIIDKFVNFFKDQSQTKQTIEDDLAQNADIILDVFSGKYKFTPTEKQIEFSKKMIDDEEKFATTTKLTEKQKDRIQAHANLKSNLATEYRKNLDRAKYGKLFGNAYENYIKALMKLPENKYNNPKSEIETTLKRIKNLSDDKHLSETEYNNIIKRLKMTAPNKYKKLLPQIKSKPSKQYRQQKTR